MSERKTEREQGLFQYRRHFGTYINELEKFEDAYGEPFDPNDDAIPEAHKYYYMLRGMQLMIPIKEREALFDGIHNIIAPNTNTHLKDVT